MFVNGILIGELRKQRNEGFLGRSSLIAEIKHLILAV
jgi:hypothetical protein